MSGALIRSADHYRKSSRINSKFGDYAMMRDIQEHIEKACEKGEYKVRIPLENYVELLDTADSKETLIQFMKSRGFESYFSRLLYTWSDVRAGMVPCSIDFVVSWEKSIS